MIYQKEQFTDKQEEIFLAWLRTLTSALSNKSPCVPAHVLRVSKGAGKGRKPRIWAIPMTHAEHMYQHQHGEKALLDLHHYSPYGITTTVQECKDWFDDRAQEYRDEFLQRIWPQYLEVN